MPVKPVYDAFTAVFGSPSDGCWQAPGRVNLIGEHTDYNGGLVLPFAIQLACRAFVRVRKDSTVRVASRQFPELPALDLRAMSPGNIPLWSRYPLGVAWALRDHGLCQGADILIDSDVPAGAGLSSSAALECAVALGLNDVNDLGLERSELVHAALRAENDFAGVPCGIMDQSASLLCQANSALELDVSTGTARQVPLRLGDHGLALLVVDTGVHHRLGASGYASRRAECAEACARLEIDSLSAVDPDKLDTAISHLSSDLLARRLRHVVTENERVRDIAKLLRSGQVEQIGRLLTASHLSLRDDFEASCREQDLAVSTALAAGALGARMIGGGFGGSVIALCHSGDRTRIRQTIADAFSRIGASRPNIVEAIPSNGARRIQ